MKPRSLPNSRNLLQLASAITALLACQAAQAALTWDGSDLVTTGAQGGSGNWNVNSTADWWNGTADVIWPALGGTNDDAVFAGTAGTVTLTSAITANDLTFNTTGYILSGAQTLTLNGSSPTLTTGSGISASISSVIGGSAGLTKAGTGTLALTGANTYTGTTSIKAGTLTLSDSSGSIASGTGVTLLNKGVLTLDNTTALNNRLGGQAFTSNGGTFNFNNPATGSANYAESIGVLTLNAGALNINTMQAASGQTSTLTIASMTSANRAAGGTVLFSGTGLGANAQNKITFTTAPTTTAGIIPWALMYDGTNYDLATLSGNDLAKYTGYLTAAAGTTWSVDTVNARPASSTTTGTLAGGGTVNSLILGAGVNLTAGTARTMTIGNLTANTPGLIVQTGGTSSIGTTSARVTLAFGTREAIFDIASGGNLIINAQNANAIMTGTGGTTKTGSGTLTLGSDSGNTVGGTFTQGGMTGALSLNEGLYDVFCTTNNGLAFTGAGVTFNGGNLKINTDGVALAFNKVTATPTPITVNADGTFTLDDRSTATAFAGVANTFGALTVNNSPNFTITAGSHVASGIQQLIVGATTLNSNATFTLNNSAGATMQLSVAAITDNGNSITLKGNGTLIQTGVWAGTGGLTLDSTYSGTATLSQANTFSGVTTLNGGTLTMSSNQALQNSALDTSGSGVVALSSITTSTLGGLVGSKDLSSVITTGYSGMTAMTLNPGTGVTNTYSGVIANGASNMTLTKSGAGTQVLSGANTYSGLTKISAGTLALTGGTNRLLSTGTLQFNGNNTVLDLGGTSQTLASMTFADSIQNNTLQGGGSLTLNGASDFRPGMTTYTVTNNAVNMAGLGSFTYTAAANKFSVGGQATSGGASGNINAVTLTLAGGTNTITALQFGVADVNSSTAATDAGTVHLGQANTINADTLIVAVSRDTGTVDFTSGLASNPSLTIRGTDTTSRAAVMNIGQTAGSTANGLNSLGTIDLTTGVSGSSSLDAMVGTLTLGWVNRAATGNAQNATGIFSMGGGTLDASTIYLGRGTSLNSSTGTGTGTLSVNGGTVKVGTMIIGELASATDAVSGTFNLTSGTLRATTVQPGAGTATRNFNWSAGSIRNYDASTDLTISSGLSMNLIAGSDHTFNIDGSRTGTVNATLASTGVGNLVKDGTGTLTLNNTNTYSGDTTVKAGTLALGLSGSIASPVIIVGDAGSSGALLDLTAKSSGFTLASTQTLKGIGTVVTNTGAGRLTNNGILAPGNSIGTLNITGDYSFGSSSVYQVETNATTSDKIAISGAASIVSGAAISFTGTTGLGNYVLATAASGLGSGTFSGAAPTGYTLKYSATELDLQHKATIALAPGSNPANVHTGSQTVNLTIGNTAPTGSADLSYTLGGVSGSGTRAPGASSTATGTYTAVAGANNFDITASDSNATNSPQTVAFSQTGYLLASTDFNTTSVALGTIHVGGTFGTTALSINNTLASGTYNESLGAALANASGVSISGSPVTIAAGAAASTGLSIGLTSNSSGSHSGTVDALFNSQAVNGSGLGTTALTAQTKTITVTGEVFNGTGTWAGAASDWGSANHWSDTNGVQAAPGTFAGYDNVDVANFSGGGATTVNLDGASPSLKTLSLSGASAYTLAQGNIGSASLQFKSDSGNANITAASTGHLISAPVILASNTTVAITNITASLEISGAISGLGLTKDGAGTLVLSGTNNYTGLTTVTGGTLLVGGSIAGSVSVSNTATLGGSGSIAGALGVSGTLESGGASSIGKLSASGGTTFNSGSTFAYDMNSTALSADILVTGALSLLGTVNLNLRDLVSGTYAANTTFSLIQYAGELSGGFFTYNGTPLTGGNTGLAGTSWRIVYGDSLAGSNFTDPLVGGEKFINLTNVSLTAIPEPGTLLALGCLVGSGLCLRSRRRDRSGGLPAGLGGL